MSKHDGILHTLLIVRGFERRGLVEHKDREHVLDADIRHIAVIHNRCARVHAHDHLAHLVRFKRLAFEHRLESVERRLNRRSHRPFLDAGTHDFVALAELIHQCVRIAVRSVREQEIVIAGKNVFHAGPARMNQQSRSHSTASRHTAERKTFLDVIRVAAPGGYAGRLLGRVIDEPSHLLRIQTCRATRG